jgi:hypothetical protein
VSVSESARDARVAPHELLPRPPGTRSGAVLRPTDNRRRRGAELLRMRYPIRLAREDRAGGGDVSEARGRGLQPYRAQHRRTAVPPRVKSRIPSSTRQSLVRVLVGSRPERRVCEDPESQTLCCCVVSRQSAQGRFLSFAVAGWPNSGPQSSASDSAQRELCVASAATSLTTSQQLSPPLPGFSLRTQKFFPHPPSSYYLDI